MTAAVAVSFLAACGSDLRLPSGTGNVQPVQYGATAADDPQAALIGRNIISAGGSAADAAVAMYFIMSVTLPSSASLGGGGVCLTFAPADNKVETLDFLARPPAAALTVAGGSAADRPTAVPGNPRGFYALHARFGRQRWEELLAPAENLARFGVPVSRGLARELQPVDRALASDPELRRVFAAPEGQGLVREGDPLIQIDLASTLAMLRNAGPKAFYSGPFATKLVEATQRAGGTLALADLAATLPSWKTPLVVTGEDRKAYFPAPPPAAGAIAGQMWAMLAERNRYGRASEDERGNLRAEAALRAFAERDRGALAGGADPQSLVSEQRIAALFAGYAADRRTTPSGESAGQPSRRENPAGAGLVAVDAAGNAVACMVTMNNLFGTGRVAAGTGIILAADPGTGGRGPDMLAPTLITDDNTRYFYFAATAAGGVAAPQALVQVAADTVLADQPLAESIAAARLLALPEMSQLVVEDRMNATEMAALRQRGYALATTPSLGQVNAISCDKGVPDRPDRCRAASDPRGFGLGSTTQ